MGNSDRIKPKDDILVIRWSLGRELLPTSIFIILAVVSAAIIGYLKVDALHSWRYTSDLFTYDTVLQEATRGHFGLEFTYGNQFGDHAYLFLLPLIPIKYLLSSKMVYLLVLLGPLAYLISSVIFFFSAKQFVYPWKAFFLSVVYLFGFTQMYRGLFEEVYGMHPDIFAGFVAVTLAAFLVWREKKAAQNKNALLTTIGAVFSLVLLVALKEEMAILGILFMAIAFLFRRTAFHRNLLLLSGLTLAIESVVLTLSKTPFNRTNNALFSSLIQRFQTNGLGILFHSASTGEAEVQAYWLAIALSCLMFIVAAAFSKKVNPYCLGLLLIGLVKLFFGLAVDDLYLFTWHNFSGLIMISAAVLFQFLYVTKINSASLTISLGLIMLASVYTLLTSEIPFVKSQLETNRIQQKAVTVYDAELSRISKQVDPTKVVAIPAYTAQHWVEFRYSFFPRGVSFSPVGIADFAVYPTGDAAYLAGGYDKSLPLEELSKTFVVVDQTPHFILFKRNSLTESERVSRDAFFHLLK